MDKKLEAAARDYHALPRPGKIEVRPIKPHNTQHDLTLAYSPGVAAPCRDISADPEKVYDYTAKGNLVAVISNCTAVLGLGDIGAAAGKPVMEGKGLLFKIYAGIDVFDLEISEKDPEKFVDIVASLGDTFGGINLEDIKAPECFQIEEELKKRLDIPVMHDDQHGTAIISAAGMLNALKIAGKRIEEAQIVVSGAGASAQSCTRMYLALGARKENIIMIDSKGVIRKDRPNLDERKAFFATDREGVYTLADAIKGADLFLGLSQPGVLTPEMVKTMAPQAAVFALANPDPEISYEEAKAARPDLLMATGRSDYPNQINNVIGFPYIFRGALDVRASAINEEMKLAATRAIAELAEERVPDEVSSAYGYTPLHFGPDYFIPKPVDPRLITRVSMAVARAAIASGVARREITDWTAYEQELESRIGGMNHLLRRLYDSAQSDPKRMVYTAGENPLILRGAAEVAQEGIAKPILLGDPRVIGEIARQHDVDLSGIEVIDQHDDSWKEKRLEYAEAYTRKNWRHGAILRQTTERMYDPNYFGMMMVERGDADGLITGSTASYSELAQIARDTVGIASGHHTFATMHLVMMKSGPLFIADTLINLNPQADTLVDIALMAADKVRCFGVKPVIALVSFSDFGSVDAPSTIEARKAIEILHRDHPEIAVEGEMQLMNALDYKRRDAEYPDNRIKGKAANVLIFPRFSAANACYQLLKHLEIAEDVIGPIQIGLDKPIYFTGKDATVKDITNITAMASLDCTTCLI